MSSLPFSRCSLLNKTVSSVPHICIVTKTFDSYIQNKWRDLVELTEESNKGQSSWKQSCPWLCQAYFSSHDSPLPFFLAARSVKFGVIWKQDWKKANGESTFHSQGHLWDHWIIEINARNILQITWGQLSHFYPNELRKQELKLKWNQLNSLPESSRKRYAAITGTNHKINLWLGVWSEGRALGFFTYYSLCQIIKLISENSVILIL